MVGQDHVVDALRNAVAADRIGHAYLFSGPRGTGKTTTARLLAKALNCTNLGSDGEPCAVCDNCVTIAQGRFFDIRELDAASNRGIDNIREVIDSTALGLAPGSRHKIYVLDEVHMLTEPASNALLKTLEEAPPHIVFVLATTNPEKVLPTIRSRTQHYEFTLLPADVIAARLAWICEQEGITAAPEALGAIASLAAGSERDAESLLDQAIAQGPLEADAVARIVGGSSVELRIGVLEAIAAEDAAGALVALGAMLEAGLEPRRVAEDLLAAGRDAFLLTAAAGRVRVDTPVESQDRLRAVGVALGNAATVRVIETLGQAVSDMRGTDAADPRLVLEVALVRLSRREAGPPLATVIERIERLERSLTPGGPARPVPTAGPPATPAPPAPVPAVQASGGEVSAPRASDPQASGGSGSSPPAGSPRRTIAALRSGRPASTEPEPKPPAVPSAELPAVAPRAPSEPLELDDAILAWSTILTTLPVATRSAVQSAQPMRLEQDVLTFGVPPKILDAARLRFKKDAETIRGAFAERLGRPVRFNLVAAPEFSLGAERPPGAARESAGAPPRDTLQDAKRADPQEPPDPEPDDAGPGDVEHELEVIDLSETVDAGDAIESTGIGLLAKELGATVVEELPRESAG